MPGYGKFCPVSMGAEVVADRWTPLILRELILGSTRFNDIARGLPGISRSLLVQRLKHLERKGVLERWPIGHRPGQRVPPDAGGQGPRERRDGPRRVVGALAVQRDGAARHRSDHADVVDAPPRRPGGAPARPRRRAVRLHRSRSGSRHGSCSIAARRRCAISTPATTATSSSRARRPRCRGCSTASSRGATPSPPGRSASTARRGSPGALPRWFLGEPVHDAR